MGRLAKSAIAGRGALALLEVLSPTITINRLVQTLPFLDRPQFFP